MAQDMKVNFFEHEAKGIVLKDGCVPDKKRSELSYYISNLIHICG